MGLQRDTPHFGVVQNLGLIAIFDGKMMIHGRFSGTHLAKLILMVMFSGATPRKWLMKPHVQRQTPMLDG